MVPSRLKPVCNKYNLEPDWDQGYGQAEYNEYILKQAGEYIENFSFLHDGEDDQVFITKICLTLVNNTLARAREITSTIGVLRRYAQTSIMVQPIPLVYSFQKNLEICCLVGHFHWEQERYSLVFWMSKLS
jgi:hypothetical protein